MSGYVHLHREAIEHPLFRGDSARLGAWLWIIAKACWKPAKFNVGGKTIDLDRGQFCCSVRELAEAWGWSKSSVDRFLTRLKTEQMIGTDAGTGRLIITVCNYGKYQDSENCPGTHAGTAVGTAAGQQRDIKEEGNKGIIEPNGSYTPHTPLTDFDECQAEPKPRAKARRVSSPPERPADVSETVWADFLTHRAGKGPVTPTVISGFRREADRVGWTLEQAISESILRGWRGFKSEWIKADDRDKNRRTGQRDNRDGLAKALDRRLGLDGDAGPFGRYDPGEGAGAGLLAAPSAYRLP